MKKLLKANPVGVALVIVFLLLAVVGVITSNGAEHFPQQDRQPTSGMH